MEFVFALREATLPETPVNLAQLIVKHVTLMVNVSYAKQDPYYNLLQIAQHHVLLKHTATVTVV